METTRTVVCKLVPTPEQVQDIDATLKAFADACNFAAAVARNRGTTNKVKVQRAGYRAIREQFGLSANLAIRAIARACAALKVHAKMHSTFEPTSIDYDARIFAFHEWNWTFGLTLLGGRQKIATHLGDRQKSLLKGRKPTAAVLVKRRDGNYYLHVQLTDEAPEPIETTGVLGVDLGIVNLAADSDGETFSGAGVERVRQRYHGRRKALQKVGTKSAKRRLRKVRMKESRYRRDTNHVISKRLVGKAKGTARTIALEDLQGIGQRTTAHRVDRSRLKGWAFRQLRGFIEYKAQDVGVPVVLVDPRNTSKTCSACGHCARGNRKTRDQFECLHCAFSACADVNAAKNIRNWAQVMAPTVGVDDAGFGPGRDYLQAAGL
jgi:putative transposase